MLKSFILVRGAYGGDSKRTWWKFSGNNFDLYILLIEYVYVCIKSIDIEYIRNNPKPWAVGNIN